VDISPHVRLFSRGSYEQFRHLLRNYFGNSFEIVNSGEVKFRRQHRIGDYVADFYCREANLVIECDGGVHDRNEQWRHDTKRDAYMTSQGIRVLRFANDRVLNDTDNVLEEIAKHLPRPSGEV
jgi:very-short-patch-repair endonuclease